MPVTHQRTRDGNGRRVELRRERHVLAVPDVVVTPGCYERRAVDGTEVVPPVGHADWEMLATGRPAIAGPAVGPGIVRIGDDDVLGECSDSRTGKDRCTQQLDAFGVENQVGVNKDDCASDGGRDASVLGERRPGVSHRQHPHPARPGPLHRAIGRTIVDDDDL